MIGALLIAAAVGVVAGAAIAHFWKNIVQWLNKVFAKVKQVIQRTVVGVQTFLRRDSGGYRNMSYNYSKLDNGNYRRDTVVETEYVDESDVPEEFVRRMQAMNLSQTETTDELQRQLDTLQLQNA